MPDGDKNAASRPAARAPRAVPTAEEPAFLCPECHAPAASIETHLRQVHRIYQFRGTRRSIQETIGLLLSLVLGDRPDPEAWDTLAAIAREDHRDRPDAYLAGLLVPALARIEDNRRAAAIGGLAQTLAAAGAARLAALLASDSEDAARRLALAVLTQLRPPVPAELHPPLRVLLLDRRLPVEPQLAAAATLVRSVGPDSPLAAEVLESLVSGLGKGKSIERLRQFEGLVGPMAAIDLLCSQLEDQLRLSCPRCGVELRRPEMLKHLWAEHRLVLDGRRVRDPWTIIEDWLDEYRTKGDPELLERCRIVGQRIDAEQGLARVQRLLIARGVDDPEAKRSLIEEARECHASRCPECYALVPVPREVPPYFINQYQGRLSARGYRVEIDERGWSRVLQIEAPGRLLWRGPEPRNRWTERAAASVLAAPFVLLALLVSVGLLDAGMDPIWLVSVILIVAAGAHRLGRRAWRSKVPVSARARNHAWTLLAPRLHEGGFHLDDSAFLAGLALHSLRRGYGNLRGALLADLLVKTEAAASRGEAPPAHLAALRRLQAEDAAAAGGDPVPLVAAQVGHCFAGRLPLAFAENLLLGWDSDWWTRGNRARLRILLCDRAFEAGFEVRSLLEAGLTAPALGVVLDTDHPENLAALRLLWSLRASRPWDHCGPGATAFEVAADRQYARLLGRYPDLLLLQEEPSWPPVAVGVNEPEPVRILLCGEGVVLQDVLFTQQPLIMDVVLRPGGTDVSFGDRRFHARARLEALGPRMERWFRYAFKDFLPQVAAVQSWQPPHRAALLRAWGAVPCPECHRPLLARVGDVGLAFEEAAGERVS
jgi:multisubunit Na+/H+ antiporter MnhG subunit